MKNFARKLLTDPRSTGVGGPLDTQLGKDVQRLWKDVHPGGGSIDTQLGKDLQRLWKDVHLGGGSINTQLGKDLQRLWKDVHPGGVNQHSTWKGSAKTLEGCSSGGGQSTLNLERICKDFGRMFIRGVDQHLTRKGSAKTLEGCSSRGVNQHSTWKGCAKTLGGCSSWGGSIDTQLGKDLQRLWKDVHPGGAQSTLNLERICKDFGKIASDNVDPGGVDRHPPPHLRNDNFQVHC